MEKIMIYCVVIFVLALLLNGFVCATADTIKIGAIFDTSNKYKEIAFRLAVNKLNNKYTDFNYMVEPVIEQLSSDEPLEAKTATCSLMKKGVVGILGPSLEHNSRIVQSICDDKDVPYLDVRWVDRPPDSIINFYPSQNVLTQVYVDVITAWGYRDFVILYDDTESMKRIARFLETYDNKNYKIVLRQLDRFHSGDYRSVLKEVRGSGATSIILDCSIEVLKDVLEQAQWFGMMTNKYNYFITNLDLHTLELVAYQFSQTNITGIRIFDPDKNNIQDLAPMIFAEEIRANPMFVVNAAWKLQIETVLVVDAVMMFGEVLHTYSKKLVPKLMDCEDNEPWLFGSTLTNLVKGNKNQYSGLSGTIEFDPNGYRNYFVVDVIELKEGGITTVGNWSTNEKLTINRSYGKDDEQSNQTLKHQSFRVLISLIEPFAMLTPTAGSLTGNRRYQGFAIDLIHELSLVLGFNYTILNQEDKRNGDFNETTGKWGGMIAEIMEGRADLAIADLTITADRQQVVDFSAPFMNLGISILYQKPRKAPPSFFSFADPFALEVWIFVALSYFTVSMVLFVLGRICASEWINPYPCIEEPEFLVNQLSLRNCFWFVSGSIMQQGTEIGPLALSTRLVAGIWWFFTLIMVSSYTANLAVFLTRETPIPHFTNAIDLVKNAEAKNIKWGAKRSGSTLDFFKKARYRNDAYGKIFDYMQAHLEDKNVMVTETKLGVEKAERENYAFFMEITSIEYEIQRRCNLTAVGKLLDEKSYGIAMQKNSTYRNILSRAILDLQHTGKLNELKRKWWEENQGGGFCENEDDSGEATPLNLKNVGGVFWVTIGGVFMAVVLVVAELILHVVKISIKTKAPIKKSIMDEFRFYFSFSGMVKPVLYNNENLETTSGKSSEKQFEVRDNNY